MGDEGHLAPEEGYEEGRAGKGEPEGRQDAEVGGQNAAEGGADDQAAVQAHDVDGVHTALEGERDGALTDGGGGGAPDEAWAP